MLKLDKFDYNLIRNLYRELDEFNNKLYKRNPSEEEMTASIDNFKLNFFEINWLKKEEIEIYLEFLKASFKDFSAKYLQDKEDLATFEITNLIFDCFFNKMCWFVWMSSVFTDILKEINDLLGSWKIKEFEEMVIGMNWEDIEKKGKVILKKYDLLIKNWY